MKAYITRFAPSPTGYLHLGSARTALINYIISSQKSYSKFFLRIEDTDKLRSKEEYKRNIIEGLKWLGIKWESEIQIQSKRIDRHIEIANKLLKDKFAYKCNCSIEKLNKKREEIKNKKLKIKKVCTTCKNNKKIQTLNSNYVIRIKIPEIGSTTINDNIQGKITINNQEIDDYILIREDGSPTYMLSVVVDDHDLDVNYIIRGDDHLNNTFRQLFIYKYLNWNIPEYSHLSLIYGEDGSKLSKRHGAVNILELKQRGYLRESIINNLILLGWSPNPNGNEIISIKEIVEKFDIKEISKSSSIFSYKKLNFFNNYYLRIPSNKKIFEDFCKTNNIMKKYYIKDKVKLLKIFEVYKKNLSSFDQIIDFIDVYYNENYTYSINQKFDKIFDNYFYDFVAKLNLLNNWNAENIEKVIKKFIIEKKIKFVTLGKPIRFILINSINGPSISDIFTILGKKVSIERLNQYIIE